MRNTHIAADSRRRCPEPRSRAIIVQMVYSEVVSDGGVTRGGLGGGGSPLPERNSIPQFQQFQFDLPLQLVGSLYIVLELLRPTQKLIKMHANFCRRNGTALPSLQTRFDYYRKRGSASYIVREVQSVREREREWDGSSETEVTSPLSR